MVLVWLAVAFVAIAGLIKLFAMYTEQVDPPLPEAYCPHCDALRPFLQPATGVRICQKCRQWIHGAVVNLHRGNEPNGKCPICFIPLVTMPDGTVPWHKDFNADQDLVLCNGWIDHMEALPLDAP